MNTRNLVISLLVIVLTSSCSIWPFNSKQKKVDEIVSQVKEINEKLPPMEPMILRSTGYGAINPTARGLTEVQKRLLAMRASKLDAYRTLAERVYGTQIIGNSTVENLVVQNDQYRAFVDANILGAKVVYQEVMADGSYETMVEMIIDEGFRNCLANRGNGKRNNTCASDAVHDLNAITRSSLSSQGVEAAGSGLYFIE
ncbi:MAG: LPP20 family lipoprotein [Reinekea sp.]